MGLKFQAWTLPSTGTFTKLIEDIPVVEGSGTGTVRMNVAADGSLAVPADYKRLSTIISDTAGSLIRVYDGETLVHEWMAEKVDYGYAADTVRISGPDLSTVFDRTVVYPYDYPTSPSTVGDWIWGGRNILSNEGFEDSPVTPKTVELRITASGGNYTLTDGTDTTSNIAWNADAATITTRIEADLGLLPDVTVALVGAGVWLIQYVTPQFGVNLGINTGGLTGGTGTTTTTVEGGYGLGAWTTARALVSGVGQLGAYDFFGVTTAQAHSGTLSLGVNPGAVGATSNRLGGAQQVVSVTPGGTYQASVWVYPTSGSDEIRFAIFSDTEELLATNAVGGAAFTPNTWTQISLTDVAIPDNVDRIIFRVQNANSFPHSPSIFYIDDAEFNEGLQPATVGEIVGMLMDDATTDHSGDTRGTLLEWVDYTGFSTSVDSASDSWDDELEFTAHRGMTYGQVFDDLVGLGYEWRLTAKATPGATTHELEWFNTGNMDAAPNVGITVGQNTPDTSVVKRIPKYTAVLVEGDDGLYAEDSDSTAETNFGRFETYTSSNQWTGTTTLGAAGGHVLDEELSNRTALQVEIVEGVHSRPLVDYTAGDTISVQFPPNLAKTDRRVHQISYRNTVPTTYNLTGSRLFPAETGAWEAMRILIRRFLKLDEKPPAAAFVPGDRGGAMTYQVAASDASDEDKEKSDQVLSGIADDQELQAIVDEFGPDGMRLHLSGGTFNLTNTWTISGETSVYGHGPDATFLVGSVALGAVVAPGEGGRLTDLYVENSANNANGHGIELTGRALVDNCKAFATAGAAINIDADECMVRRTAVGGGSHGILVSDGIFTIICNCYVESSGIGISVQADYCQLHHNQVNFVNTHGIEIAANLATVVGNLVEGSGQSTSDTYDNFNIAGNRNLIHSNFSIPNAATRYGLNIASGTNNNPYANFLDDASTYASGAYNDSGTGTLTSPSSGQFSY